MISFHSVSTKYSVLSVSAQFLSSQVQTKKILAKGEPEKNEK
jgi:hypothetical protein